MPWNKLNEFRLGLWRNALAALIGTAVGAQLTSAEATTVQQKIHELMLQAGRRSQARVGLALSWTSKSGQVLGRVAFNQDERFDHASAAKWLWAALALKRQPDKVDQDIVGPTFATSDNITAGRLIDIVGGLDQVRRETAALGISPRHWSTCSWLYVPEGQPQRRRAQHCLSEPSATNSFTPRAALQFLELLYFGEFVDARTSARVRSWGKLAPRSGLGGWLPSALPSGVAKQAMHKAGYKPARFGFRNTLNEIGIIPGQHVDILLALSFEDSPAENWERQITEAVQILRQIYIWLDQP